MGDAVIVGLIAAIASIIAAVVTSRATQNKMQSELHEQNAIQNVKIDHLTEEVRKHNDFASRIPVLETRVQTLERKVG